MISILDLTENSRTAGSIVCEAKELLIALK